VREYLDIFSAKDCELVLHRVFSCPMEIFRSSIQVTSPSIYQPEQGFHILKESVSIFNNNNSSLPQSRKLFQRGLFILKLEKVFFPVSSVIFNKGTLVKKFQN
jgi:hypothetical protein